MKKAEGFVTEDGTFFENEREAKLYEAEWRLRGTLSGMFPELNQERFFAIILGTLDLIGGYINAYNAASPPERTEAEDEIGAEDALPQSTEVNDGLGHVSSAEEDLTSLLKLPARGPQHVPDVGRRTRSKKVPDRREEHGA